MSVDKDAATALQVNPEYVLGKCSYFRDVQLWPLESVLDPARWLNNFHASELEHAVQLLNGFMYFAEPLVDAIFTSAFQNLSTRVTRRGESLMECQARWRAFVDSVIITYVTGEVPSPTDSGYSFARKARQILGIPDPQILTPEDTLRELLSHGPRPVVFVDDFVGSGGQFRETWRRPMARVGGVSFDVVSAAHGTTFYYCPAFCTEYGLHVLAQDCPKVLVSPGHVISHRYSAVVSDSVIWPPRLRDTALDFLQEASKRAGLPDTNGAAVNDWRGFHSLGLSIALHGSVPDATLPLFHWDKNGWHPLIPRK